MRNKGLLLILLFWGSIGLYAQFDPHIQIQQPSAEAQSFNEFSEIPVDLFTGRVAIDIPLYEVKCHDISIPISISYHGGGIKVSDEAGAVGLGWTLNVGGVVSRIVRGFPDDLHSTSQVAGYEKLNSLTLPNGLHDFMGFINTIKERSPRGVNPTAMLDPTEEQKKMASIIDTYGHEYDNGHFDTSPDNYMFQVQDLSGAFVHQGHEIILQTNSGCRVSRPNNMKYEITDANGYKYLFEDVERQDYHYKVNYNWRMDNWNDLPEYNYIYNSAWWLSNITSASGEQVAFEYADAEVTHAVPTLHGYTQRLHRTPKNNIVTLSQHFHTTINTPNVSYHKQIQKIETPLCIVLFTYSSQANTSTLPKLHQIDVYERSDMNNPIRSFGFEYSSNSNRAKLTQLTIYGADETVQRYTFSYYSDSHNVELFDKRSDHWGYFAPQSGGRFPAKSYLNTQVVFQNKYPYTDRYADNSAADNNMLRTITYPTGNITELVWEPHSFGKWGQLGETADKDDDYSGPTTTTEYVTEQTFRLCGKENHETLSVSKSITGNKTIEIDFRKYYYLGADGQDCIYDWNTDFIYSKRPTVRVKKDGQLVQDFYIHRTTINDVYTLAATTGNYTFELLYPREMLKTDNPCDFPYTLFNRFGADETDFGYVNISIGYEQTVEKKTNVRNIGGVRIKRITHKEDSQPLLIKEYDYILANGTSSGVLVYPPRYSSMFTVCETIILDEFSNSPLGQRITDTPNMLTLRSNGLPFTLNGGSHIEYERVVESLVESPGKSFNDATRKPLRQTIYNYWTSADAGHTDMDETEGSTFVPSDMLQLTSQSYQRGHLRSKTEYTDEERRTDYVHDIREDATTPMLTGSLYTVADFTQLLERYEYQGRTLALYKDMFLVKYRVIPYNKRLSSVKVTGDKTNTQETYTYANSSFADNLNVNMPTAKSFVDSEGNTIWQYFTYLNAHSNKVAGCVTVKNGRIIDAYRYEYDAKQRITAKYTAPLALANLPSSSYYNIATLANRKTETYIYDSRNRLVQFTDDISEISTVYLWGYNNTYPIAEIQNATYSAVVSALGEQTIKNLADAASPDAEVVQGLHALFPQSMVSIMTYSPLVGMTSFTDAKGSTTYYSYNGFGQVSEVYRLENGQKQILQHIDYHYSH